MDVAIDPPYTELVTYLALHPELEDAVRRTLRHVDNAVLATRIRAKTLIAVGLRDTITPPSTVFAAFNAIEAPKEIAVYPYAGHCAADKPRRAAARRLRHRVQGKAMKLAAVC